MERLRSSSHGMCYISIESYSHDEFSAVEIVGNGPVVAEKRIIHAGNGQYIGWVIAPHPSYQTMAYLVSVESYLQGLSTRRYTEGRGQDSTENVGNYRKRLTLILTMFGL